MASLFDKREPSLCIGGNRLVASQLDADDLEERKTLKVKVPQAFQLRLHALKVLTGQTISEMVEEALDEYFAQADELPDEIDPRP